MTEWWPFFLCVSQFAQSILMLCLFVRVNKALDRPPTEVRDGAPE